ncbi:hypothetical protein PCAR4_1090097 [Paraburkholderia caribensis]|nr:hypothetical protein PCAR4_1090097 [Paraburkholderia caribensis]
MAVRSASAMTREVLGRGSCAVGSKGTRGALSRGKPPVALFMTSNIIYKNDEFLAGKPGVFIKARR